MDYKENVLVLDLKTPVLNDAENIGTIQIGDSGFSTKCEWNAVIETAKAEII